MVEVHTWGRQDNVDKNIAAQHRYREGELMARHIRVDSTCYDNARLDLTVSCDNMDNACNVFDEDSPRIEEMKMREFERRNEVSFILFLILGMVDDSTRFRGIMAQVGADRNAFCLARRNWIPPTSNNSIPTPPIIQTPCPWDALTDIALPTGKESRGKDKDKHRHRKRSSCDH
ncbi:hypothetical protein JHK87_022469 [Glycine soja]|nr:hypothetical protein JHK87_022469 [Glycine soja]